MAQMRPIDELPDKAVVTFMRNQSMFWLVDGEGVEYVSPAWLSAIIDSAWNRGYREVQRDMREALGFVEPTECDCCQQGMNGKVEVTFGG